MVENTNVNANSKEENGAHQRRVAMYKAPRLCFVQRKTKGGKRRERGKHGESKVREKWKENENMSQFV